MRDYIEQKAKLENHLIEHPHDYQSKVQLMMLESRQIDYEHEQAMNLRMKKLAEIKRRREQDEKSKQ